MATHRLEPRLPGWLDSADRFLLVSVIEDQRELPRTRVAARNELVRRHACVDCGVAAGRECQPEYGCNNNARRA